MKLTFLIIFICASFFINGMELSFERCNQQTFNEMKYLAGIDDQTKQQLKIAVAMLSAPQTADKAHEWMIKQAKKSKMHTGIRHFLRKQCALYCYNQHNFTQAWRFANIVPEDNDMEFIKGMLALAGVQGGVSKNTDLASRLLKTAMVSRFVSVIDQDGKVKSLVYASSHAQHVLQTLENTTFCRAQKSTELSDKIKASEYLLLNSSGLEDTLRDGLQLAEDALKEMQKKMITGEPIAPFCFQLRTKIAHLAKVGSPAVQKNAAIVRKKYNLLANGAPFEDLATIYSKDDLIEFAHARINHPDFLKMYLADSNFVDNLKLDEKSAQQVKEKIIQKFCQNYSNELFNEFCTLMNEWIADPQLDEKKMVSAIKSLIENIKDDNHSYEMLHHSLHKIESKELKEFALDKMSTMENKLPVAGWSVLLHSVKSKKKIGDTLRKLESVLTQALPSDAGNSIALEVIQELEKQASKYPQLAYRLYELYRAGVPSFLESDQSKAQEFLEAAASHSYPQALLKMLPIDSTKSETFGEYEKFFKKIKPSSDNNEIRKSAFDQLKNIAQSNPVAVHRLAAIALNDDDLSLDEALQLFVEVEKQRIENRDLDEKKLKIESAVYQHIATIKNRAQKFVVPLIDLHIQSLSNQKMIKKETMELVTKGLSLINHTDLPENLKKQIVDLLTRQGKEAIATGNHEQAFGYFNTAYTLDQQAVGLQLAEAYIKRNADSSDVHNAYDILKNLFVAYENDQAFIKFTELLVDEMNESIIAQSTAGDKFISVLRNYSQKDPVRMLQIIIDLKLNTQNWGKERTLLNEIGAELIKCSPDEKHYMRFLAQVFDEAHDAAYEDCMRISDNNRIYVIPYLVSHDFLNRRFQEGVNRIAQLVTFLNHDFFKQSGPERFKDDYSKKILLKQAITCLFSLLETEQELDAQLKDQAEKLMFDVAAAWPKKFGSFASQHFFQRFAQRAIIVIDRLEGSACTPKHLLNAKYIEMLKPYAHFSKDIALCITKLIHIGYLECYDPEWGSVEELQEKMSEFKAFSNSYKDYTESRLVNQYIGAFNNKIGERLQLVGKPKEAIKYYKRGSALFNYNHKSVNKAIALIEDRDELETFLDKVAEQCDDEIALLILARMFLWGKATVAIKNGLHKALISELNPKSGIKILKKLCKKNNPEAILEYADYCLKSNIVLPHAKELLPQLDIKNLKGESILVLGKSCLKEHLYEKAFECFNNLLISKELRLKTYAHLMIACMYKNGIGVESSFENMKKNLTEYFKTMFVGVAVLSSNDIKYFGKTCAKENVEELLGNQAEKDWFLLGMLKYLSYINQKIDFGDHNVDEMLYKGATLCFNLGVKSGNEETALLCASSLAWLVIDQIILGSDEKKIVRYADELVNHLHKILEINPEASPWIEDILSKLFREFFEHAPLSQSAGMSVMSAVTKFIAEKKIDIDDIDFTKLIEKYLMIDNTQHVSHDTKHN